MPLITHKESQISRISQSEIPQMRHSRNLSAHGAP
jgi:hypothetical protein